MTKISEPLGESQLLSLDHERFQEALEKANYATSTQHVYLRAFDDFGDRLDRTTPGAASRTQAHRHLTELKQAGVSKTAYGNASAMLRFLFEDVRGIDWKPISPLQKRMVEDMCLFHYSPRTQDSYVRSVSLLARYYNRSPDLLNDEEIRAYFVYLTCKRKLARSTITIALSGIKFFYEKTLKRNWSLTGVPVPKRNKFLPVILSRAEVHSIVAKIYTLRHRACLSLIYACGLRLGEGCAVKVTDIDRERMQLHVRGKGSKDRYVVIPASIFPMLEDCWRSHRNPVWLFPFVGRGGRCGPTADRHVPKATVQEAFREARKESGVTKKVSVHSFRHAYATHLLEAGVSMRQIQMWMGHSSIEMTAHYAQLTTQGTNASGKILERLMVNLGKRSE